MNPQIQEMEEILILILLDLLLLNLKKIVILQPMLFQEMGGILLLLLRGFLVLNLA